MPVPATLKINELFWSFQGEGSRYGISSVFLRLSGCSLRCPYCDTPQSWQNKGELMPLDQIMERIGSLMVSHPGAQLVVTGGEPLEQDLGPLVHRAVEAGFFIALETNGIRYQNLPIDWWAVAPKRESGYYIHPDLCRRADEIKLVVTPDLTLDHIRLVGEQAPKRPIFLQPDVYNGGVQACSMAFSLFEQAAIVGLNYVRVGMQLHRVYGVP